jgi:hypothetical protein
MELVLGFEIGIAEALVLELEVEFVGAGLPLSSRTRRRSGTRPARRAG